MNCYEEILAGLQDIPVIDTHEHLPLNEGLRDAEADLLTEYFTQYIKSDMISAGMPLTALARLQDRSLPLADRWREIELWWHHCRHTGYGRGVRETVRALYGADDITAENVSELDAAFRAALRPGRYREILKDRCRIETSLLNNSETYRYMDHVDLTFFTPVYHLDWLIDPDGCLLFDYLEESAGIPVRSFPDWLDACSCTLERLHAQEVRIFKIAVAYVRSLDFPLVDRADAQREFEAILSRIRHRPTFSEPARCAFRTAGTLQNFMVHELLRTLSRWEDVTVQIHTGLHEGNWNDVRNSDPSLLTGLFARYDALRFDVFHMGYPFQNKLTALAKNDPNVYVDLCWAHILSPNASVGTLCEWIDTVPLNKILAFGGDYSTVEQIAGHLILAKANVARALAIEVERGLFDAAEAVAIGKRLFYDNPKALYRL